MEQDRKPLVIVWCIAYNQVNYIKDALEGFIMQKTNFCFEVVVHDDASTDGTSDIINQYAADYPEKIKCYIEKDNQWKKGGLPHILELMNTYHRRAKYIGFCEGDDYWTDPNKLQRQVDFLETHPDYSMCFHSAHKMYECNTVSWINCEDIQNKDYDATDLFVNWTVPTASVLCRKEAMDFYANIRDAKNIQNYDIFIILCCAMVGKIRGMQEQMSVYRIQSQGLTYNNKALIRTIMNNPEHFKCLKTNFPIVNKNYVDDTISKTYFERALIQTSLKEKFSDYFMSFHYNYSRFFKMSIRSILKNSRDK